MVVSGTLPAADGRYSLYCAVIVKRVDAQTRAKTSINELLRSADSPESPLSCLSSRARAALPIQPSADGVTQNVDIPCKRTATALSRD